MYESARCCVANGGYASEDSDVLPGVRQGWILSPFLFNVLLESLLRKVNDGSSGIQWTFNTV